MRGGRKERRVRRNRIKGQSKTWPSSPLALSKKKGPAVTKADPNSTRSAHQQRRTDDAEAARARSAQRTAGEAFDRRFRDSW